MRSHTERPKMAISSSRNPGAATISRRTNSRCDMGLERPFRGWAFDHSIEQSCELDGKALCEACASETILRPAFTGHPYCLSKLQALVRRHAYPCFPPRSSLVAALLVVSTLGAVACSTATTDGVSLATANGPAGCIYQLGVRTGTGPTTYAPNGIVTRNQMAAFLARTYVSLTFG